MFTASYYKIASKWYFDYPTYIEAGGDPEDLERVGGMHDLLELISCGSSSVQLLISFEPFEGADEGVLISSTGGDTGAYYQFSTINGQPFEKEIWVDGMIYLQNIELPQRIYGRRL